MTPSAYKARYEKLQVSLPGGGTVDVKVNQYKLKSAMSAADFTGRTKFIEAVNKNALDGEQHIDTTTKDSPDKTTSASVKVSAKALAAIAQYAFVGKGAPEHCQLILEYAAAWGLATPATQAGVQDYADKWLGLDCNGFVGNYLWHCYEGKNWDQQGVGNLDKGPDLRIDDYFGYPHPRKPISKWGDLNTAVSYLMVMVDDNGRIIPGGTGNAADSGHIVVTEPGRAREKTTTTAPAVWAVESTAGHSPGLWESWYSLVSVDKSTQIFTMKREEMIPGAQKLSFKIAPV
jgi:hypothetical protein